jgi:hypothetical protein
VPTSLGHTVTEREAFKSFMTAGRFMEAKGAFREAV